MKSGDLTERTLGIIGLGRIGFELVRLVEPFGMTVLAYDPFISADDAGKLGVELIEDIDHLLQRSDYVSLHLPSDDQTRGLINSERIAAMKKGAILVNTARGDLIESLDILADALESGQLGMIGLDVFSPEPPDTSHRLFQNPRCVCAPHMLGVSELAMERIFRVMADGMVDVLQGRRPEYCVNPEVFD